MKTLLEHHLAAKAAIVSHYHNLAEMAEEVGMRTLASDIRQGRIPKLEAERFHLVILGEFNHGKSTFVNALLGREFLPVGITPTTAAINHVVFAEETRARAVMRDGAELELEIDQLRNWVTVAGDKSADVRFVEIGYPCDLLRGNVTLVDTPGVNDLNEQRAEVTYGYVPRADAVIFLLDASQALKDSEREFLASHVLQGSKDRMIFVLGKIDLLSESERDAVLDYVRSGLGKLIDDPVLIPVSAKQYLAGEQEESGFPKLLDHLTRFLDTDRAQIILDNATADGLRTSAYLQQNLGVRLHSLELEIDELEERVQAVRRQLDASKRTLDELHTRIRAEARAVKSQVRVDLEEFVRAFTSALPEQIDAADADDIKRYLGPFVEDKFREWAELEGARVAALLESLAEDVIKVTNENVAAASTALASRLGPGDADVPIDVDTFRYDVGVYAIGALGTTLFLFVNTLAGGLLTLAAPVLAIVVKSKVTGDIRQQARERVPAAIERAAQALGPHFDTCVDDFADRLCEFVTSAGNTLYRGISEILDQTIEERRKGEGQVEGMRAETTGQIRRVEELRDKLLSVRDGLWEREPGASETN